MSEQKFYTLDANEAVARVAYPLSEVVAIYPITPSSPMGDASSSIMVRCSIPKRPIR